MRNPSITQIVTITEIALLFWPQENVANMSGGSIEISS